MASKHSSASLSTKERQLMSKKEQKMALVAQRLAMLRGDDDDDQNCNPINSLIEVTDVVPLKHDSETIHGTKKKLKSKCDDSPKQNCLSESPHGTRKKLKSNCDDSPKQNCISESTHGTSKKLKSNCDDSQKQNCVSESTHVASKKLKSNCDDSQKQNCVSESTHGERKRLKSNCDDSQKQSCVSESTHGTRKKLKSKCDDSQKQNQSSESTHGTRKKLKSICNNSQKQNCTSESTDGTRKKLKSICDDSQKQNCISTSTNPVRDLDENSPCDSDEIVLPSGPSSNQKKNGSHKRRMVISDDESEQDGKMQCLIQPNESFSQDGCHGGTTQKQRICSDNNQGSLKIISIPEQRAEDKLPTPMDRAIKVQAKLSAAHPSFVKKMLPSHVAGGFWLGLCTKFCEVNLPKQSCTIVLIDEAGIEFETRYLVHKRGLSGGWKGFAVHQALQEGDVLVFHLIDPTIFKVYIVREDRINDIDGALELLGFDTCAGQIISGDSTQKVLHTEDSPPIYSSSPSNSDIDQPEVFDGIRLSDSDINFNAIEDFNNFNIIVDGLVIDSKFTHSNRKKYYDLCLSQNCFLHQHLLKGMNCNLVIGIILETVNIADAIRACDSSTSIKDLQTWKTTLNGFELVGMKVDFLCDRLNQLMHVASELNQLDASKMSETYTLEIGSANGRVKALEDKLAELKGVMEKIDSEIEAEMTASAQKYKARFDKIDNF